MSTIQQLQNQPQTFKVTCTLRGKKREIELSIHTHKVSSYIDLVMPCNYDHSFGDKDLLMAHGESAAVRHIENCKACAVVLGVSKATVMNQDEVARLFALGIYGMKSQSGRVKSEQIGVRSGRLVHYSTTEAIRLDDGTVINNNQCWSAGYASCPHVPHAMASLPLSTIEDRITSNPAEELRLIDKKDREVVFAVGDRYFLDGVDEGQEFMTELLAPVKTVDEAYETMKPQLVKDAIAKGVKVLRHGDIFCIPMPEITDNQVTNIAKRTTQIETKIVDVNRDDMGVSYDADKNPAMDSDFYVGQVLEGYSDFARQPIPVPMISKVEEIKYLSVIDERQKLFGTRHYGTRTGMFGELVVVKGTLRHEGREHRMTTLGNDTWHVAMQATFKESFKPQRFGHTRRD